MRYVGMVMEHVPESETQEAVEENSKNASGDPTPEQLAAEVASLRARVAELEALEDEVAERKRMQEVLRQRERTVWTLLNATMDMAYLIDENGVILSANERYARRFGLSLPDIVGRNAGDLYDAGAFDQRLERIRTVIRTNTAVRFEEQFQDRYTHVQITPIINARGEVDQAAVFVRDMTRRRLAEQAVRRGRELYAHAMEYGNTGVWEYWPAKAHFSGDINLLRMLGYAEREFGTGLAEWEKLVLEKDLAPILAMEDELASGTHRPLFIEVRVRTKDGRVRWLEVNGRRLDDWRDGSLRYIGCAVDITERKQAEQELMRTRGEFQALAENSPDIIARQDRHGRFLYINAAVRDVTNREPEEFLGLTGREAGMPKGLTNNLDQTRKEVFSGGGVRTVEFALRVRGGKRYFQCLVAPEHDVEGTVETIMAVARDITARKQAEDEMRNLARFPAEDPNPVLRFTPQGRLIYANKASEHLLDCWELRIGDVLGGEYGEELRAAYSRESVSTTEVATNDGRSYGLVQAPIVEAGYINVYGNDITLRVRAEEEARRRQEQLINADKMVSLGILSAGVAHEVNNPNNFIMVNAPILDDAWKAALPILKAYAEEHGEFRLAGVPFSKMSDRVPLLVDGIKEGARRIKDIVKSMKDFARQEDAPSHDGAVDVNELIHASLTLLANTVKRSTNHLVEDYAETLPMVRGSFGRLEQVLVNVIMNACQALPSPDRAIVLRTRHDETGGKVLLTVEDQGKGIEAEDLLHILDPFFTTKRNVGGMGLGLSISNTIIREHGGELIFESEPGKGTSVTIALPVHDVPDPAQKYAQDEESDNG